MRVDVIEQEHEVILGPADGTPDAAVIWLHGLGADGHDFVPMIPELQLPAEAKVRFVFPHAAVRPVTINAGHAMRAWYDIRELTPAGRDDAQGFAAARTRIEAYIAHERAAGIAAGRIVLAGFSQGGAVALHVGLRHAEPLAGIIALSCYLPLRDKLEAELAHRATPILMCHGSHDDVVDMRFGELSRDLLVAAGLDVQWHSWPMGHSVCAPEIAAIAKWLQARLQLV